MPENAETNQNHTFEDDTDQPPALAEQMEQLNHQLRELRDEAILKPAAALFNTAGVETPNIDEISSDVSLIEEAGIALLGPVLASNATVLGFYTGIQLTNSPNVAFGVALVMGLLAGAFGLFAGPRYLRTGTIQEDSDGL